MRRAGRMLRLTPPSFRCGWDRFWAAGGTKQHRHFAQEQRLIWPLAARGEAAYVQDVRLCSFGMVIGGV